MEVLFVLIPLSVVLAAAFVAACLAAIRGGQYDDLESPRWRMLFDGAPPRKDRNAAEGNGATASDNEGHEREAGAPTGTPHEPAKESPA